MLESARIVLRAVLESARIVLRAVLESAIGILHAVFESTSDILRAVKSEGAIRRAPPRFDPEPHENALRAIQGEILRELDSSGDALFDTRTLDRILRKHPRDGKGFFSRAQLIAGLRHLSEQDAYAWDADALVSRLRLRPVRSQSGVTPVTVLTQPYPCPGRCIYCPNDVRMPKSYLSDEPGAQRAADNRFDPYLQTWNRLAALRDIGHPTDKIELIVLGGTWSFYPQAYQRDFVTRCFEAMADFGAGRDARVEAMARPVPDFSRLPARLDGRDVGTHYNRQVARFLAASAPSAPIPVSRAATALELAQRAVETGNARCVGLVLETRPDCVSEAELLRLRQLGCTKVQLGVQSLDDSVLFANRRGHDVAATRRAFALLRRAGFKILAHWMPNLLGSNPDADKRDFGRLFDDPDFRPDELKIYPCSLIESAELMGPHERGEWRPYDDAELLEVLTHSLEQTPRWCRLSRVIRDISSDDIVVGNQQTNFRERAERALTEKGAKCVDVRSREIRRSAVDPSSLQLRESRYASSAGQERFLEWVTPDDRLAGLLRMTLPREPSFAPELGRAALLRELHVYGHAVKIGCHAGQGAQHRGLGRGLVLAAALRARAEGFSRLAVISAVGTRAYYRELGFGDGALYQHLNLESQNLDLEAQSLDLESDLQAAALSPC